MISTCVNCDRCITNLLWTTIYSAETTLTTVNKILMLIKNCIKLHVHYSRTVISELRVTLTLAISQQLNSLCTMGACVQSVTNIEPKEKGCVLTKTEPIHGFLQTYCLRLKRHLKLLVF